MKNKLTVIAAIIVIASLVGTVHAAWYTVNNNPQFSSTVDWQADTWMEGTGSHSYYISGGNAYTYLTISGFNKWGNTEYEQGTDPWATYGNLPYTVTANLPQRLIVRSTSSGSANWLYGRMNQYVEFWLTNGTHWAEAMIIHDSEGIIMQPMALQNSYWATQHSGGWYYVGYRHWDTSGWTYRETNLNQVFNLLASEFGCNLSDWTVSCICVGVEGTSGTMSATWDYVIWDVGM